MKKKTDHNKNNTKKTIMIIAAAVLLLAAVVMLTLFLSGAFQKGQTDDKKEDHKGVVGVISDDWDPGVEEPTDSQQRGGTKIPGYSSAEMNAGDKSLVIRIGNPKDNKVGFFASLVLSDGTVLYESGLLKPGQGLDEVPLNQTLEKGTYDAKVVYQCVLLDGENTPLNAAESGFKLYVN